MISLSRTTAVLLAVPVLLGVMVPVITSQQARPAPNRVIERAVAVVTGREVLHPREQLLSGSIVNTLLDPEGGTGFSARPFGRGRRYPRCRSGLDRHPSAVWYGAGGGYLLRPVPKVKADFVSCRRAAPIHSIVPPWDALPCF